MGTVAPIHDASGRGWACRSHRQGGMDPAFRAVGRENGYSAFLLGVEPVYSCQYPFGPKV